jgi:ABC-type Fe3+ transport system permease subunit
VVLCTLVLVICAIAALAEGITELTTEPGIHRIGQTEPSAYDRAKQREAGIWWLIIATVLTAMATTAVLALRAAWRKRR